MIWQTIKNLFRSRNAAILSDLQAQVKRINALEGELERLSDAELMTLSADLKKSAQTESLDSLLPKAFALVREVAKRVLKMRHYDVQLLGAIALHRGHIAEMQTGEGKTLMATLAVYLNALSGKGVHVVTVNDYLARRDAEWMRPLYEFLGLTVGVVLNNQSATQKKSAYRADVTYGTNNEFGFDYLRDNMVFRAKDRVQRPLNFAIVDEVDSILIDEARTPLIISGALQESTGLYETMSRLIPKLVRQQVEDGPGDYWVDEKQRQVHLSEQGFETIEAQMRTHGLLDEEEGLYSSSKIGMFHYVEAALRAHVLFRRDIDYIVHQDHVLIVDEHTGRVLAGRRWSDGLHQAVEAKEGVTIQPESQTLAAITFQNYFRLYHKLSGMTGTAATEAHEFYQIYRLEVVTIPSNRPCQRKDYGDLLFSSSEEKFQAILSEITVAHQRGQPVLVGTASIEVSEYLSQLLKAHHIVHTVLNAKRHAQEAQIIAEAGQPGAVTIATNMAGRGTDIVLGGRCIVVEGTEESSAEQQEAWLKRQQQVVEAGGLYVIGTERHESRRIDNQLRGRSGRQGDPGMSRFYLSLDDHLMRVFIAPSWRERLKRHAEYGYAMEGGFVNRAIRSAQKKLENQYFEIRKQLLDYDGVANEQRQWIYAQRRWLLEEPDLSSWLHELFLGYSNDLFLLEGSASLVRDRLQQELAIDLFGETAAQLANALHAQYAAGFQSADAEHRAEWERAVVLSELDVLWKEHLAHMDHIRHGINLRGYAQRDPKQEYKREAFELFSHLLARLRRSVVHALLRPDTSASPSVETLATRQAQMLSKSLFTHGQEAANAELPPQGGGVLIRLGRNQLCHCGSGKKFKYCHGQLNA